MIFLKNQVMFSLCSP